MKSHNEVVELFEMTVASGALWPFEKAMYKKPACIHEIDDFTAYQHKLLLYVVQNQQDV